MHKAFYDIGHTRLRYVADLLCERWFYPRFSRLRMCFRLNASLRRVDGDGRLMGAQRLAGPCSPFKPSSPFDNHVCGGPAGLLVSARRRRARNRSLGMGTGGEGEEVSDTVCDGLSRRRPVLWSKCSVRMGARVCGVGPGSLVLRRTASRAGATATLLLGHLSKPGHV